MAVTLVGSGNDRIEYGAIHNSFRSGTWAITFKPSALTGNRFFGKWGSDANNEQGWLLSLVDTNEMLFSLRGTNIFVNVYRSAKTTDVDLTVGTEYKIVVRWYGGFWNNSGAGSNVIQIWVNGVQRTVTDVDTGNIVQLGAGASGIVTIGHEADTGTDGVDGDYSEHMIAHHIWTDNAIAAYSAGFSPAYHRYNVTPAVGSNIAPFVTGGVLYAPLRGTTDLIDWWGNATPTLTGGADVQHPGIYYPTSAIARVGPAAPIIPSIAAKLHQYKLRRS